MHYHCEIVLPVGTEDIESAIAFVMDKFYEGREAKNGEDKEDVNYELRYAFWDFYVIGGRYAGQKLIQGLDKDKLNEFYKWTHEEKITVSGFQCGKQEIQPAEQIPKVDAKWNELFPKEDGIIVSCPLFAHSNDQYGHNGNGMIDGDICKLADAKDVKCEHVIFAGPSYNHESEKHDGPLKATFMLIDTAWNSVNHMDVRWDGTVGDAFSQFLERVKNYKSDYRELVEPTDDWIVVTIDYHS